MAAEKFDFPAARGRMLLEITAHAMAVGDSIGKAALDPRVMAVMGSVPRHIFVPAEIQQYAYRDQPLPIGHGKTISQPFIVALMTDLLALREDDRVLEIGTGLGYQAAVLAGLARSVHSVEIIEELAQQAARRLRQAGCNTVQIKAANGYYGWPEHAPFDKIIVTTAPQLVPPPLLAQLNRSGRMVIPCGLPDEPQQLTLVEKDAAGRISMREILPVRFTPLEDEA